jgi:hypothetical protein
VINLDTNTVVRFIVKDYFIRYELLAFINKQQVVIACDRLIKKITIPYIVQYLYHSIDSRNNNFTKLLFSLLMPEKRVCSLE